MGWWCRASRCVDPASEPPRVGTPDDVDRGARAGRCAGGGGRGLAASIRHRRDAAGAASAATRASRVSVSPPSWRGAEQGAHRSGQHVELVEQGLGLLRDRRGRDPAWLIGLGRQALRGRRDLRQDRAGQRQHGLERRQLGGELVDERAGRWWRRARAAEVRSAGRPDPADANGPVRSTEARRVAASAAAVLRMRAPFGAITGWCRRQHPPGSAPRTPDSCCAGPRHRDRRCPTLGKPPRTGRPEAAFGITTGSVRWDAAYARGRHAPVPAGPPPRTRARVPAPARAGRHRGRCSARSRC